MKTSHGFYFWSSLGNEEPEHNHVASSSGRHICWRHYGDNGESAAAVSGAQRQGPSRAYLAGEGYAGVGDNTGGIRLAIFRQIRRDQTSHRRRHFALVSGYHLLPRRRRAKTRPEPRSGVSLSAATT